MHLFHVYVFESCIVCMLLSKNGKPCRILVRISGAQHPVSPQPRKEKEQGSSINWRLWGASWGNSNSSVRTEHREQETVTLQLRTLYQLREVPQWVQCQGLPCPKDWVDFFLVCGWDDGITKVSGVSSLAFKDNWIESVKVPVEAATFLSPNCQEMAVSKRYSDTSLGLSVSLNAALFLKAKFLQAVLKLLTEQNRERKSLF